MCYSTLICVKSNEYFCDWRGSALLTALFVGNLRDYLDSAAAKKNFRDQIRAALTRSGWQVVQIDGESDWWADEHWTIRSATQAYGCTLVVSFLVDPQYDGPRKSSAIWEIPVGTTRLLDRLDDENRIAVLGMQKGHFAEKLDSFILEMNRHRDLLRG